MVRLGAFLVGKDLRAPLVITRYNMYPAAAINGNVAPGTSTGDAIAVLEKLAEQELPQDRMAYEWTELTFLEKQARNTGAQVFALSVMAVFLILAALYESWAFPLAVILVVPVCVACSLGAVWLTDPGSAAQTFAGLGLIPGLTEGGRPPSDWLPVGKEVTGPFWFRVGYWIDETLVGTVTGWLVKAGIGKQDVNIFTQVGFVVLVGLACKNAILIVEFAKIARDNGTDRREAVLEACKLRFRPIMMTSVAFMLGVLPLAVAKGAGAEMRQALGVAVLGGMLGVTAFGVILTPVFFVLTDRFTTVLRRTMRRTWTARQIAIFELAFSFVVAPGLFVIIEFGFTGALSVLGACLASLLAAVLFGMVIIAAVDTGDALGGGMRLGARTARKVGRAARTAVAAVRKIRLRGAK
jgi:hypothetical protein